MERQIQKEEHHFVMHLIEQETLVYLNLLGEEKEKIQKLKEKKIILGMLILRNG